LVSFLPSTVQETLLARIDIDLTVHSLARLDGGVKKENLNVQVLTPISGISSNLMRVLKTIKIGVGA
jgi:hypothetical protein